MAYRNEHGLTQKQEAFAVKFVECGNASEAYRHAYDVAGSTDKSIWEAACRLLRHDKVAARVDALRAAREQKATFHVEVTHESLAAMLAKSYAVAEKQEKSGDMTSAAVALGKLTGLWTEKVHNINEDVTESHLQALRDLSKRADEKVDEAKNVLKLKRTG